MWYDYYTVHCVTQVASYITKNTVGGQNNGVR